MKKKNANKFKVSTVIFMILMFLVCIVSIGAINNGNVYKYNNPVTYEVLKSNLSNESDDKYVNIDAITPVPEEGTYKQNIIHNPLWYCCQPFTVLTSGEASYKISKKEISETNTVAAYIANYEKNNWDSVYSSNEEGNSAIKKYTQIAMWLAMSDGELSSDLNIDLGGTRQEIITKYSNTDKYADAKNKVDKAKTLLSEAKKFASTRRNGEVKISINDNNNNLEVTISNLTNMDKVEVNKGNGYSNLSMKIDSNGTGTADIPKNGIQGKITVKVSKVSYSVGIIKLTHDKLQDLLCMNPSSKVDTFTNTFEVNSNISLQKYIYNVIPDEDNYVLRCDIDNDGKFSTYDGGIIYEYLTGEIGYHELESKLNKYYKNVKEYLSNIGADMDANGVIDINDIELFFCDIDNDGIFNIDYNDKFSSKKEWLYFNKKTKMSESYKFQNNIRQDMVLKPEPNERKDESHSYSVGGKSYGWWAPSITCNPCSTRNNKNVPNYKWDNPVEINNGDTVVYAIEIYNNSNVDTDNIVLTDAPSTNSYDVISVWEDEKDYTKKTTDKNYSYNLQKELLNGNQQYFCANVVTKDEHGNDVISRKLFIRTGKLDSTTKSRKIYVAIKYKYSGKDDAFLGNEVALQNSNTNPVNKTEYRTYDGDYVKLKQYSVSLEKFVSSYGSHDGGWSKELTGTDNRSGKRYNRNAEKKDSKSGNYDDWKLKNPYYVENGDMVIFTIRVKNTGETPIKVTQIQDTYTNKSKSGAKNKLVYNEVVSAIQYTSDGKNKENGNFVNFINDDSMKNNNQYGYFILDKDTPQLEPNEYMDIKVKFWVESTADSISTDPSDESNHFINIAKITQVTDSSNRVLNLDYDSDKTDNNQDEDHIMLKTYSVSLEKFVTKVQSADLKDSVNIPGREGKRYNWDASDKNNSENYNKYKIDINNMVSLEDGDKVTFTIRLKNTGKNKVEITQIDDWHSSELSIDANYQIAYGGDVKSKTDGGDPHEVITFKDPKLLNAGEYVDIEIRYNINAGKDNKKKDFYNKAKIITSSLQNKNGYKAWDSDGPDNNQDEDHVKLKKYMVSLEKYVTKVTDANGNNAQSYTDREYKRYNENAETTANKNEFKKKNVVQVEAGDLVTFTIKLKNEDTTEIERNTTVVIKEITDIPVSNNGNSLEYVSNSVGATVNNENGKYKVTFATPIKITAQNSYYFTMTFKVDVAVANTKTVQSFSNKAQISTLYNKNDKEVLDSDGTENNVDQDFIKTKVYAVSLEKYIEKVVTSNGDIKDGLNREGQAEHAYDNDANTKNDYKETHVVEADCGSEITYVIKINNDGDTNVKFLGVQDYLPQNTVSYKVDDGEVRTKKDGYIVDKYEGTNYGRRIYLVLYKDWSGREFYTSDDFKNDNKKENAYNSEGIVLKPKETKEIRVTITTDAPNLSLDVYKNTAQINYIENRNGIDIIDTTQNNNKDSDYFKMNSSTTTPTSVKVLKEWAGYSENEKFEVEVGLYENGNLRDKQKLNKNNAWAYVWNNLSKDAEYTVKELTTGNFVTNIEQISDVTFKITNTKKVEPEKTSVTVVKDWNDENNKAEKRPSSVTVALYQNGVQQGEEVTLSSGNSWKNTWENLAKYDADGNEYVYTVKEIKIPDGYSSSISFSTGNNVTTIKITNTYTSEKVSKAVIKKWEDENNKYGNRPDSITVGLYADEKYTNKSQTLSTKNSWSYTWNDLDKYDKNGKEIVYTVKELGKVENYITKYDSTTEIDTITNIYDVTEVSVSKKWNVKDQNLIKSINVELYQNNNKFKDVTLNNSNNWYYKWENLPKYDSSLNEYIYTIKETTIIDKIESRIYKVSDNEFTILNEEILDQDFIISGIVWNDVSFDKNSSAYNNIYDKGKEDLINGINVYLYRNGISSVVAQTTTDSNGYYCFKNMDIKNVDSTEKYIKAKVKSTTDNKWDTAKGYYSYTVVFEYDGIKYTSTFDGTKRIWSLDDNSTTSQYANYQYSNAEENYTDRTNLNKKFSTINNNSGIEYGTVNVTDDRIPQSRYKYNSETMSIKSSTERINIGTYKNDELKLQHVNLGLRGRDTLDLELTSDVYSVDVTVNGQTGTYYYNNKITISKNDIGVLPDAAHITNESRKTGYTRLNQMLRETDVTNDVYENGTGLGIRVTYKITVLNSSVTNATATKIVNYYDNKYEFISAKYEGKELSSESINGGTGYSGQLITTNGNMLAQSQSMDIYVTYELKGPVSLLSNVSELPTYNMSEIYEYKSECANGQSEFTRGLIDVDSAPGSANTENARLKGNKTDSANTVQYYFNANNLDQLKYEDDTYATPVLYFVKDGSKRKLSGNVFEDLTKLNSENVKTGNGKKDNGEINVYGATVELVENGTTRFTTITDKDGNYTFEGFLPGNYIVRFRYGDTDNTVVINTAGGNINAKSFNGEDYQSTNNTGSYGAEKISDRNNYWYLDNESEGISTATDNNTRRGEVSNNVYNNSGIMQTLNGLREGKTKEQCSADKVESLKEKTKMDASTQNLLVGVEKAYLENDEVKQRNSFDGNYEITNMNFGIAEVPVSTVDLQKHVDEFEIVDSAGINTIAKIKLQSDGKYKVEDGDVLAVGVNEPIDVSIENEKLQGAKLRITYVITAKIKVEKNFDGNEIVKPTFTGLYDFIDNNLEYNKTLGDNEKYWKLISYNDMQNAYKELQREGDTLEPKSTVVTDENTHKVIIEATEYNPLLDLKDGEGSATLVLEKVLSSNDSGIEGIQMDTQNMFGYGNIVEIKGLNYTTPTDNDEPLRDRVRTTDRYIIIPGGDRDTSTSEEIVIHPPTGDGGTIGITYYIVGLASLCILAIGVFGIKKFIIKR